MQELTELVFVYGTLKRGFCRNHYLQSYEFVAPTATRPLYRLYDCGEYPAMIRIGNGGTSVQGEIWRVDHECLLKLDEVEAVAEGLYFRSEIELADAFDAAVQGYLYALSVEHLPHCGGNWTKGSDSSS